MKKFVLIMSLIFCIFGMGCGKENTEPQTEFMKHSRSFPAGEVWLDLIFASNEEDVTSWSMDFIDHVEMRIENENFPLEIESLQVEERARYGEYYQGTIIVEGIINKSVSGKSYLRVYYKDREEYNEYEIGQIAVIDKTNSTHDVITYALAGGVVKEDHSGKIRNYGVVVHWKVAEEIMVTGLDFGFDNLGVSGDDYIIYTSQQYQSGIKSAIENDKFDKYVNDAYEKQIVSEINKNVEIALTEGEYYIYFPIEVCGENIPELDQGALKIKYQTKSGKIGSLVTNSWPYFSAYVITEEELIEMFQVK